VIDIALRTILINDNDLLDVLPNAAEPGIIQYSTISEESPTTRIFYQRAANARMISLSGTVLIEETDFDIECMSADIDIAQEMADVIKDSLHGFQGSVDGTFIHSIEVEDHADDYNQRGQNADEGLHSANLSVKVKT
jgi:hypothetical protein